MRIIKWLSVLAIVCAMCTVSFIGLAEDEAQEVMSGDVESMVPEEELTLGDVNSDMGYSVEPSVNSPEDWVIMAPEGITDEDELDLVPYFVEADDSEGGQAVMASTADVDIGEYTYNLGDGGGTIVRYNGREGTVYVPSSVDYGGRTYKVTKIAEAAFSDNTAISEVILPESILSIGWGAFRNCTQLSAVTINSDLANCSEYNISGSYDYQRSPFYNAGTYSDSLTITFGDSVTRVPSYIFATKRSKDSNAYAHVTKVIMGENITDIGAYAFYNCYNLAEITWSAGLRNIWSYAFANDISLTSIDLPAKTFKLDEGAFAGCTYLETVVIPYSTQSMGWGAFRNCTHLSAVTINGDLGNCNEYNISGSYDYQRSPFYNAGTYSDLFTVTFGESVTRIPSYIFATERSKGSNAYAHVTKVVMGDNITDIGACAFWRCYDLKEIKWSVGLKNISNSAFCYDTSITTLNFPEKLFSIGGYAFASCSNLQTVSLPASLQSIGYCAFKFTDYLRNVVIRSDLADCNEYTTSSSYDYERSPFYGAGRYAEAFTIVFSKGVTRIPAYLFCTARSKDDGYYCRVKSVTIPETVKNIGEYAFYNCHDLSTVNYGGSPSQLKRIGVGNGNSYLLGANVACAKADTTIPKNSIRVNASYFPDAKFRSYVSKNIDKDHNGWLSADERNAVKEIDVHNSGITQLTGISRFPNLSTLQCQNNRITKLDLSRNTKLSGVDCSFNKLSELYLGDNSKLSKLYCYDNKLTSLYLKQVPNLKLLWCDSNKIKTLDLSKNTKLKCLSVYNTSLQSLNIKGCQGLKDCLNLNATIGPNRITWRINNNQFIMIGKSTKVVSGKTVLYQSGNPKTAAFKNKRITMKVGDSRILKPILTPTGVISALTWSTSNNKVATVNKSGKVVAVAKGTATITVKTGNNKTAKIIIIVK